MKAIALAAAALFAGTTPAAASVFTMGSSLAESCYRSAEARNAQAKDIRTCDTALSSEALPLHDRVGTHVNRGILWMISGDLDRANKDFDDALSMDPTQPEAWLNKGIAQMKAGNSRAAVDYVGKAIELRTIRPEIAYYVRGIAHEDSGNLNAAYSDLVHARDLAPKWRDPALELARYQVRSR